LAEHASDEANEEASHTASDGVTLASLYKALGGTFTMMEAVAYLSGQQPAEGSSMAPGLLAMGMCLAVITVLAVRRIKMRDSHDAGYDALSA